VATRFCRNVRQGLFYFVNLAGHGVHINFVGVLSIDDFNLVDDAAVIFSHIHFNRFAGFCLLRGFNRVIVTTRAMI